MSAEPHWQAALADHWGIEARLTLLDGEYDLNFLAEAADGKGYILKAMRVGCAPDLVDMQVAALQHLARAAPDLPFPQVIPARAGAAVAELPDEAGQPRLVWLLQRLPGKCYAGWRPHSAALIGDLGRVIGQSDAALAGFTHPYLARDFKWNLTQAGWIVGRLEAIADGNRRAIVASIAADFDAITPAMAALPNQAIHNDINDYNILVDGELSTPACISGLIDLGDMCAAPRICNLAIAAAYVVLDHPAPEDALVALVRGYHAANPLDPSELDLLWPLLRARLAVSVVNSTLEAADKPDDPYVTISQAPAWRFLENGRVDAELIAARLRVACGLPAVEGADRVMAWLDAQRGRFAPVMGQALDDVSMGSLSVENSTWPQNPFHLGGEEAARIGEEFDDLGLWLGYYGEPRLIYTDQAFRAGIWKAANRRTVHMAVDAFAPAGHDIHAPLEATVYFTEDRAHHLDYGGMVILAHETPEGDAFYTLYGHLDPTSFAHLREGDRVAKGEVFCRLGTPEQNGGWSPHIHFQLALTVQGMGRDWPGVADPDQFWFWRQICPNPAALLNLPEGKTLYEVADKGAVLAGRRAHFGGNLSLTYRDPVMFLRGWRHHLFDEWGRPYLDAYNNVPHVGHAHPRLQAIAADQLKRMNSNTRYLHPAQVGFAEKILSKLPDTFEVCYFVNSGSEANELALRLARAATGAKGIVTPDHGYHGNTTGAIDISAYKFNAPGGVGPSDWVELVEVADDYRGSFRRDVPDRAARFAGLVPGAIAALAARGHGLAGFIAETYPSVGGQIIPPPGYLAAVYAHIRAAGGICIADEVQTGLGRLGECYFAFEEQGATPDIVVLGKPIGNGHPIGVVVTTRAVADAFAQGPEFFSTFGGSTLSCRLGQAVLDIVDAEGLQDNAREMGARLLEGLRGLQARHAAIGDVRGRGLFVGVDLVRDRETRAEATEIAAYVKNRMRDHRILMGSEGPRDNILKIRPPLTIEADDVDMILSVLDEVLAEVAAITG